MLDESSLDNETRFTLYYKIAVIDTEQGSNRAALENFFKAEKLISTRVINMEPVILQPLYSHSIDISQIHLFNNMGKSYEEIGDADNALAYFMKALKVQSKIESVDKAKVYNNIGLLFFSHGQYGMGKLLNIFGKQSDLLEIIQLCLNTNKIMKLPIDVYFLEILAWINNYINLIDAKIIT